MRHRLAIIAALLPISLAPAAVAQTQPPAAFSTLGPLAGRIATGASGAWTAGDDDGRLVLDNPAGDGAIRFYVTDWQGDLATGRSASVRVVAAGKGNLSAAGLLFRLQDNDPRWLAFVETAQGKLALYTRHPSDLKRADLGDIPGGHLATGDLLTLNQQGDTAQLLANGHLVSELKPADAANAPGPVGIVAMDTGAFDFSRFTFGKLVQPITTPAANPTQATSPAIGDDAIPATVPSLRGLGRNLKLGDTDGWIASIQNNQLVYAHPGSDHLGYYDRSLPWPAPASTDRSATITVDAAADGPDSAGGLGFGISDDGGKLYLWGVAADGKAKLYRVANDRLEQLAAFDPPNPAPGGGRHVLKLTQTADTISLSVDGKPLHTLTGTAAQDTTGAVGLAVFGKGRFAFQDFAFGPAQP